MFFKSRPAGISRKRFCELTDQNRSNLYYKQKGESKEILSVIVKKDRLYFDRPTASIPTIAVLLHSFAKSVLYKKTRLH